MVHPMRRNGHDDPEEPIVDKVAKKIERDNRRWNNRTKFVGALAALLISISVGAAIWGLLANNSNLRSTVDEQSKQITELQTTAAELQLQVNDNTDRVNCRRAYDQLVSNHLGNFLSSFGDTAAAGFLPDIFGDLDAKIQNMQTLNDLYKQARDAREVYEESGAPLPCPIPTSQAPSDQPGD